MSVPRFSILILSYTKPDLLEARLQEINQFREGVPSFEVVVCDNGSPSRSASLVVTSARRALAYPTKIVRLEPNRGFGQGFNHAMDEADGEIWICMSDDVQVVGDFLTPLDQVFQTREAMLVCQNVVDWPGGWNVFGGRMIRYPQGHFLAAPGRIWNELGRFDGRFSPNDYEDVDLGMEADQAGIPILAMPDLPLVHAGAGTIGYSDERREQTIKMRAVFADKWVLRNEPERP